MVARAVGVAAFGRKKLIVYNDNGTINLNLTASAGPLIVKTAERLSNLLRIATLPATVSSQICVDNIYCVAQDSVVFWDGLRLFYNSTVLINMQFAYNVRQGAFPVKVTEVGGHVQYFGRSWQRATKYVIKSIEALHG